MCIRDSYETFYYYLRSRKFDRNNHLMKVMEGEKRKGRNEWSDIEAAIEALLAGPTKLKDIEDALDAIQVEFSTFLDSVVNPQLLTALSGEVRRQKSTVTSLAGFIEDVVDGAAHGRMSILQRMNIGDLFNFRFVDFNYTPLLDNYIYLDKEQFDPHPYRQSDRNLDFRPNPHGFDHPIGFKGGIMVSYVVTEVVHPHGAQHTPRSILFGIDSSAAGNAKRLAKPYWAQNAVRHESYFGETHLFIIFGCSLGNSDQWWWSNIADALMNAGPALDNPDGLSPDLLLYWRRGSQDGGLMQEDILKKFAAGAGRAGDGRLMQVLRDRAYVILYDDATPRAWLNL